MSAMRRILLVCCIFIGFNANGQTDSSAKPVSMDSLFRKKAQESIGKKFPVFDVASIDGQPFSNESLKGKVVFINFWFAACPPCIAELPYLNELYSKFAADKNFEYLSFTFEKPETIRALQKKYHLPYKIISVSRQECYRLNQNNGFPTTIIVGKDGMIKELFTGGSIDPKDVRHFIKKTVYKRLSAILSQ